MAIEIPNDEINDYVIAMTLGEDDSIIYDIVRESEVRCRDDYITVPLPVVHD